MTTVQSLLGRPVGWLAGKLADDGSAENVNGGNDQREIVLSTRIRLARNLADHRFRNGLTTVDQRSLVDHIDVMARQAIRWRDCLGFDLSHLGEIERTTLLERRLISRDLVQADHPAALLTNPDQTHALMINEEDHLRLQVLRPGLALIEALEEAVALDRRLEEQLSWAVDSRYGYLTACPTNVGTGLRASVMVHLPGLAETDELPRALRGLTKLRLVARGLYGEGSDATGHFLQVSNQATLGRSEEEITRQLADVVKRLIRYEGLARTQLLERRRSLIEDRVFRAWGVLVYARRLTSKELIEQLGWLRLGRGLGLLQHPNYDLIDELFLDGQPGHLQILYPAATAADLRDEVRATHVRQRLTEGTGSSAS